MRQKGPAERGDYLLGLFAALPGDRTSRLNADPRIPADHRFAASVEASNFAIASLGSLSPAQETVRSRRIFASVSRVLIPLKR